MGGAPRFLLPGATADRFDAEPALPSRRTARGIYPPAQPAHSPSIDVIAQVDRPEKAQELRFNLHSPLRLMYSLTRAVCAAPERSWTALEHSLSNRSNSAVRRLHSGRCKRLFIYLSITHSLFPSEHSSSCAVRFFSYCFAVDISCQGNRRRPFEISGRREKKSGEDLLPVALTAEVTPAAHEPERRR
jgi:hypothetical protein